MTIEPKNSMSVDEPDIVKPDLSDNAQNEPLDGNIIVKSVIRELLETIGIALVLFFLLQTVIRNFQVDGHSMVPNLQHGQYLMVDKISYRLPFSIRAPERGDVIVFTPPVALNKDFVKRIIGLPGDTVEMVNGEVFVNGESLPNSFGAQLDKTSMPAVTVPEDSFFVLGDNRANSNDSRNWGILTKDAVVGKVWLSYFPPQLWGTITNDRPTQETSLATFINSILKRSDETQ